MTTKGTLAPKRRGLTASQRSNLAGYLFIAPQFLGILCFTLVPVFFSLFISFTNWDMMSPIEWVGLKNYIKILSDGEIYHVLKNTLYFVAGSIPLTLLLSLVLALALNTSIKGVSLYRTAYFLPNITSSVAVSLLWIWLYNPELGLINILLSFLGITGPDWLSSFTWAMPAIIIVSVWQSMGYNMVILLAGLKGIDPSYYEAALIDGASGWDRFRYVTLPMLTPTLFFIITMGCINGFQVFNEVYMMTQGGPADATKTIVMHIYNTAFQFFRMGEAAVSAWVLFIIVLAATVVQFKLQNKWVNYDV